MHRKARTRIAFVNCFAFALAALATMFGEADASGGNFYLEGIGYREQALQQPKTSFFQSEDANGVLYASFAGGTNIFIRSPELNENPGANVVYFTSVQFNDMEIPGPPLDEDDNFNSNPLLGFITYRLPSPSTLLAVPDSNFDLYNQLDFYLSVKAPDIFGEEQHLKCSDLNKCRVRFHKSYTPVVFYLSPPVLYYESFTEVWFDPKATPQIIQNLKSDEMPFVNTEIGGSKLDFEYLVDSETAIHQWTNNRVRGQVGEMPVGHQKDIKMLWEVGWAKVVDTEALHCTYDNQRCYNAMNVPVIFNISSHVGYTSGAQNLTIYGHGFNDPAVTVTVAGVDCVVTQYQEESVSCELQAATAPTHLNRSEPYNGTHLGSHGMRRRFLNSSTVEWGTIDTHTTYEDLLATSFEAPTNMAPDGRFGNKFQGWFIAPATTSYRFHLTCDDLCDVHMGLNTSDPLNTTRLTRRTWWTSHRNHWRLSNDAQSMWVNLTQGEKYYLQGRHYEGSGGDNFAVGVEINQTAIPDHHHSMKEIQYVSAGVKNPKYDTTRITVTNPDKGGTYFLNFQNPSDLKYTLSEEIPAGASASNFRNRVKGYYWSKYRSDISVNRTMYMANGTNTTNETEAASYVYHIRVKKLITTPSVSNIMAVRKTQAQVQVELPSTVMLSDPPLNGTYRITCPGPVGNDIALNPFTSEDIPLSHTGRWIALKMYRNCSGIYDKLEIWNAGKYPYWQNGISLYIRFIGKNGNNTQMRIVSGLDQPLTGGDPADTNAMEYNGTTIVEASTNLFYEVVPFEMLRTFETQPQVIVNVGDYPAVCKNLTCNYHYVEPEGEVTAFTFNTANKQLQLTGTALPANASMIRHVEFAHSKCTLTAVSNTSVTCTLDHEPVCGDHLPKLVSIYGLVNSSTTLNPTTITCTVSAVQPTTQLNLLGGDNLTISGTQFPWQLSTSTVELKFNDAQKTECTPQTSTSTELVCLTKVFDKAVSAGQTLSLDVKINGQTVTNSLSMQTMTLTKSGLQLNPPSASPVLKTKINITLEADFAYVLNKDHFTVNATNISNPSYFRQMNVIAVDDSTKTLTCMFGGAWSGRYQISIRHKEFGLLDTAGLIFTVGSNVTSYTPMSGSVYGGTLLTITGTNFGKEFTDNPVQISTLGGVGSVDCYLKAISETEIKCRLDKTNQDNGKTGKMLVFLKTSEEAVCVPNDTCAWTYTSTIPEVTDMVEQWDATNNYWTVVVTGTGFTGDTSTTELNVNGRPQTTISVTATQAVFRVTNITGWTLHNINIYFDVGFPTNYDSIVRARNLTLSPRLVSVSPNAGSIGGSLLIARLEGLGPLSDPSQAYWNQYGGTLVNNATGDDICESVIVKTYGELECVTKPGSIAANTVIAAQSYESRESISCTNTNAALCQYQQLDTDTFPVVSRIANGVSNQIVFTGTDFYTSNYLANASYGGAFADTVTIDSATQATATWTYGLPPLGVDTMPSLWFNETGTKVRHYANISSSLLKRLTVTSATSGLSCSFAGGCNIEVQAEGLSTILKNDSTNNFITVCEEKCEFLQSLSDSTKAVCKMPKMSTVYSNAQFKIETQQDDLRFRKVFGNLQDISKAFDNQLTLIATIDSSKSECFVGGSFKANHVGMLSQVKYFMGDLNNKDQFVDKLKFQGSADNRTWTDLFTADDNIHEGWNYFKWETSAEYPKYRYYRLYSAERTGCLIGELKMTGVETVDNSDATYSCPVAVEKDNEVIQTVAQQVTYSGALTPLLTAMNPRFGTVTGGTSVTFTGTSFSTDTSKYTIIIDKRTCTVTAATATSVTCTTDHRPGLIKPSLEIYIDGQGLVSNQQKLFRYVSMWSDDTTWGGEFAPMHMESIYVPEGLNLYIDVDKTPELNLVMVEGSLIFAPEADPNHERYFDARYIFLNNAYMEVGTEEFPYTSKLTITMHGNISSPYLPIFGNKCIAVKHSVLDMHGIKRTPTWTVLDSTVEPGATQITLAEEVDWVAGEQIAIAATSFNGREGEKRTIKSIDKSTPTKPVITLDLALDFKHFAMLQTFGNEQIDMRAEVGLLTRNVKYRGDPENSLPNQYGATIFLHSEGDDSLVARLEYIELTDVGQAFKVGRYAVHFHMIGAVHKSYCKGFGTHQGFNRAFTLHGTHYLRIMNNVAFDVKGHTIFIEDAVEKKNHIQGNLIMKTKRSWSLLNTDQTPGCFWITNPDNNFIDNHAAGSDRYGYWYDLQIHAIGPHANTNVCPENERVGEFVNNHAHSCGRYGLRIFHNMIPRKFPCKPITYDHSNTTDPWHKNPAITANFYNLTSWKNGRNGAIAEKVGDVRFHNFKVADNKLAGIEFSLTDDHGDNTTRINNALIIGRTLNTELALELSEPYGMIGPRTENFRVENTRFYNFDWGGAAALSSCSHCFHPAATDSGARTIRFSNLTFDSSVKRIANYQYPWRAIFLDEDGTLTGKGPGSWATPYFAHHNVSECEHNATYYGGVFCDNTVQVRRIAFHGAVPAGLFRGMGFKILRYDDNIVAEYGNKTEYLLNKQNYATMIFKKKLDPSNGWATPFVTGHKYKIHFGMTGLDYEQLTIDASERWEETDKSIYLVHNWTDVRQAIDFRIGGSSGWIMPNDSIPANPADWSFGQNVVYNETAIRETHFIVNGKNQSGNPYAKQRIHNRGHRCLGACNEKLNESVPNENRTRYWNNSEDWPNGTIPAEGDDVHIEPGWNMVFNLNPSPVYKLVRVNGNLTFDNTTDTHLKVKHLFIRAGELHIGSEEYPYEKKARITLYGEKQMETIVYDNAIEAGNKLIANVNVMRIYGKKRAWKMTRLVEPAGKGSNSFFVEPGLEMFAGDRLGLLPTSYEPQAIDDVFVSSYDSLTGKVEITTTLNYYHWGQPASTGPSYNGLDMRGEVILLTRNVVIDAEDIESWGGQIVTSDTMEIYGTEIIMRTGTTVLDSVEVFNCSQIDTFKAAIRFESASTLHSSITNSAIHNGYAWGLNVKASANIHIKDNIFFQFRPIGVGVTSSRNVTLDDNIVSGIVDRTTLETGDQVVDLSGAFSICAYNGPDPACTDIKMRNNLVAGSVYGGFVTIGHNCGDYSSRFEGNVAHSIHGFKSGHGLYLKNHPSQGDCVEFSNFKAYKCYYQGAFAYPNSLSVVMSSMTLVDNREGMGAMIQNGANEYDFDNIDITFRDIKIYSEYGSPDCPQGGNGGFCLKYNKYGYMSSIGTQGGKDHHIGAVSPLPPQKVKSIASWGTRVELYNVEFINFKAETEQGMKNRAFQLNPTASDLIPMQEFYDTTFQNCEQDALGFFFEPPQKWAIIKDCGNFPCTAPKNTLFSFKRTKFRGLKPSYAAENFQMIPDTPNFSELVPDCEKHLDMNLWTCKNEKLGILQFESEDPDTLDRSMQPIYSRLQGTTMNNKVNSFMDHVWDGFYTGQTRLSRFPILVYAPTGAVYDIIYTGSPAKKMKYTLVSQDKQLGLTVRIAYPSAESRQILKDGQRVDMNQWDEAEKGYGSIKQSFCGENRYIGVKNILEFYITQGCVLQIAPRDAIQTMVRMEWTMNEFFSNGGTTKFIDRVAGSLGIHASTIKIVSVYEGSVVLNYDITVDTTSTSSAQKQLAKIQAKQTEQFATGQMDLGAPILDVQAAVVSSAVSTTGSSASTKTTKIISGGVVTAPGYDPIVISNSAQTQEQQESVFVPDIPIMQVNTTYVNTEDVYVDRVDVITHVNKFDQPEIINVNEKEITIIDSNDETAVTIIIIAVSILFVIFLGLGARFLYNRMRAEKAKAEQIKQTQKNLHKDGQIKVIPREKGAFDGRTVQVGPDKDGQDEHDALDKMEQDGEIYEEQYDPNQEFRIFGIGDKTKGGVQSLQQKMNMADDVSGDDSSSDENEDNSEQEDASRPGTGDKLKLPNPQSDNKCDTSVVSAYTQSMNQQLLPDGQKTPQGSIGSSSENKNVLPEDNEIVDEEEEEE